MFDIIELMYNWSVDEKKFKRSSPEEYAKWRILQLINYGLDGEKLDLKFLKKIWPEIKNKVIDPWISKYLEEFVLN